MQAVAAAAPPPLFVSLSLARTHSLARSRSDAVMTMREERILSGRINTKSPFISLVLIFLYTPSFSFRLLCATLFCMYIISLLCLMRSLLILYTQPAQWGCWVRACVVSLPLLGRTLMPCLSLSRNARAYIYFARNEMHAYRRN